MAVTTIEEAVRAVLIADSGVNVITTRCYPGMIPQDAAYPLILYMKVTGNSDNLLNGLSGLAYTRMQIESWAETYASAKALAVEVKQCLNAKKYTKDSVAIGSIVMQSENDFYEDAVKCHRIIQDYTMWHTES